MKSDQYEIVIVGAGFFGLFIGEYFGKQGKSVLILEREADAMQKASFNNQARIHNGYHYPRSVLTASSSKKSFPRFTKEFEPCVYNDFTSLYAIGKKLGKVSAKQFATFCDGVGIPYESASSSYQKYFNPNLIEEVFLTQEYAFNSSILKEMMLERLKDLPVEICFHSEVSSVKEAQNEIELLTAKNEKILAKNIFNCTYGSLNQLNFNSGLPLIPLKNEMAEMCIMQVPDELKKVGVTVMCGPFFSFMPFPAKNAHSLSHVRYTPHFEWMNENTDTFQSDKKVSIPNKSAWAHMIRDASRYMPVLEESKYLESLWEVKTILIKNEQNDGRPILFNAHHGIKYFHQILGGKIDNVYDIAEKLDRLEVR